MGFTGLEFQAYGDEKPIKGGPARRILWNRDQGFTVSS